MKFQPDRLDGVNVIGRHDGRRIWVNATEWTSSVLVPWQGAAEAWGPASVTGLTPAHFERLLAFGPELVIFGSGNRLRFVSPALHRALMEQRIGIETMDTAAACRTYNVLASEGRAVAAALILETGN